MSRITLNEQTSIDCSQKNYKNRRNVENDESDTFIYKQTEGPEVIVYIRDDCVKERGKYMI